MRKRSIRDAFAGGPDSQTGVSLGFALRTVENAKRHVVNAPVRASTAVTFEEGVYRALASFRFLEVDLARAR
jgi:hypothetical protein